MNQSVVHSCVEHALLVFSTTLHADALQVFVPLVAGFCTELVECSAERLFLVEVQAGIFHAYERYTYTYFHHFVFSCVEREPCTYIVATHFLEVRLVDLVLASCVIPCSFCLHRAHHLPETAFRRYLVDTHHEVDWEYGIRHITECTCQLRTFDFAFVHETYGSTSFVSQTFTEVHQDVTLSSRESETGQAGTWSSCKLTLDAILVECIGIVTRSSRFVAIATSVIAMIYIESTGSRHQEQ